MSRHCGICKQEGHNARTCTQQNEKPAPEKAEPKKETSPQNEQLEKIKRAVAIQNIGSKNLDQKVKEGMVLDSVVDDPSFWDWEQRKMISRELRKLRDEFRKHKESNDKSVLALKEKFDELVVPNEIEVLPHVPGKLLDVEIANNECLEGIIEHSDFSKIVLESAEIK